MNTNNFFDNVNNVPFFNGTGANNGEYNFSVLSEVPADKIETAEKQIIQDLIAKTADEILNKHT